MTQQTTSRVDARGAKGSASRRKLKENGDKSPEDEDNLENQACQNTTKSRERSLSRKERLKKVKFTDAARDHFQLNQSSTSPNKDKQRRGIKTTKRKKKELDGPL